VVGSFIERAGNDLHIAVVLVDGSGLRGLYRALHLSTTEGTWATPGGAEPPVVDLPEARVGLLWGADLNYPESARLAALQGADVVCVPAALDGPETLGLAQPTAPLPVPAWDRALPHHFHLARLRAYENNTAVAFANRGDHGAMGESGVFGPELGADEALVPGRHPGETQLEIVTGAAASRYPMTALRAKELLQKRVPALYAPLVQPRGVPSGNS
jgi:predicted amidohydrolase